MPTGKKVASKAGKLLEDKSTPKEVKSVAASAEAQVPRNAPAKKAPVTAPAKAAAKGTRGKGAKK